jgi:hypothetical protein
MWRFPTQPLAGGRALKLHVMDEQGALSYAAFIELLTDDADFRASFSEALAEAPYAAYKWETPPVTAATLEQAFECVLLDSPELDTAPDPTPFATHLRAAGNGADAIAFENLGGDALMIVPLPAGAEDAYAHLGAFARLAPAHRQQGLWAMVGRTMRRRVGSAPIWLGTAGGGVAWLHVRLDSRPKYYGHAPYREPPKLA